ncbi:uncharacterized protein ZBAI_05648 [Zygosaccharomyces bailii ISA1307]|nr:uncharacterized protein ZBAI_05648 [Zygosaccharomyces bailii ISA1307]
MHHKLTVVLLKEQLFYSRIAATDAANSRWRNAIGVVTVQAKCLLQHHRGSTVRRISTLKVFPENLLWKLILGFLHQYSFTISCLVSGISEMEDNNPTKCGS